MPNDIAQLHRLKAQYCRFIDTKQWQRLRDLLCDDATFDGFGSAPPGADADTFVAGVSQRLRDCVSVHHCHMPEIVFESSSVAKGIWAMMDHLQWGAGFVPAEAPGTSGFTGFGYYEERYRNEGGQWKFLSLRLTRLRLDPLTTTPSPLNPGRLRPDPTWI